MRRPSAHTRRPRDSKPPHIAADAPRTDTWRRAMLRGLLVLAVSVLPMAPVLIAGGFPETHELVRYPAVLVHFSDALDAGVLYPRWLPYLAGAYGYPTFVFYQPLFFFIAAGFERLLAGSPSLAIWAACFAFSVIGTTGMYRLARLFADVPGSLFATVVFALTPYAFVDLYVRGDVSEFAAIEIVPWALFFAAVLLQRSRDGRPLLGPAAGLAAALSLIVLAHPLIALPAWGVLVAILAVMMPGEARSVRLRCALATAAAFSLALVVTSVYWYPAFQLRRLVRAEEAFQGVYEASLHVVYFAQLFDRTYGFGASTMANADDGMSFQLGLPHFLLATLGVWFGRRHRLLVACYAAYLALVLLMLPVSAPLWKHVGLLKPFQFPWRLLGVIATLQAACSIGWALVRFDDARSRSLRGTLLILLAAATALWHSNQLRVQGAVDFATADELAGELFRRSPYQWQTFANVDEFLPRTASAPQKYRGERQLMDVEQGVVFPADGHSPYHLRFDVRCQSPTEATIHQFYFPGWRVVIDGAEVPRTVLESRLAENGRIRLALPACPDGCTVEAWYAGPPGDRMRWIMAFATLFAFVLLLAWHDRRTRSRRRFGAGTD